MFGNKVALWFTDFLILPDEIQYDAHQQQWEEFGSVQANR